MRVAPPAFMAESFHGFLNAAAALSLSSTVWLLVGSRLTMVSNSATRWQTFVDADERYAVGRRRFGSSAAGAWVSAPSFSRLGVVRCGRPVESDAGVITDDPRIVTRRAYERITRT